MRNPSYSSIDERNGNVMWNGPLAREYRPIVSELEFTSLKTGEAYIKFKHYRPKKVRFLLDRKGVV